MNDDKIIITRRCRKCKRDIDDDAIFCQHCGTRQDISRSVKRRGNGQGTVFRRENGKWCAMKTVDWLADSDTQTVRRRTVSRSDFATKRDAVAYLSILGTELDTRTSTAAARQKRREDKTLTTLKQLYDLWLPTHQRSQQTMNCYRAGFALFSDLFDTPMRDIDVDDLQEAVTGSGKGRRTQENARAALGLVYKYGIPRGFVPANVSGEPNLAKFLKVEGERGAHKDGLTDLELQKLWQSVGRVRYAAHILCHCYLGFRPAAFLALTVRDYDPDERAFIGGIKTAAGIGRTVTVSPKIQPLVDELLRGATGSVFRSLDTGEALTVSAYRDIFYSTLAEVGIQPISEPPHRLTPHSCRHTFATLMKRVSAPDTDKLALIGHTDTAMLRHYQDVRCDDLRRITDAI